MYQKTTIERVAVVESRRDKCMTEYLRIREGKVGTDFGDVSKMVEGRFDYGGYVGIKGEVAVKKYTKAL